MQETRQHILEILRELGQATVDEVVDKLRERRGDEITAVTVRHHLVRLQEAGLITTPELRHRSTPGRPQHIYALTDQARRYFPNNYAGLIQNLLEQLQRQLHPDQVDDIIDGIVGKMTRNANLEDEELTARLGKACQLMNQYGYNAEWRDEKDGNLALHIYNCPYYEVSGRSNTICTMDMRLIETLIGAKTRLQSRVSDGGTYCVYLVSNHNGK